MSLGSFVTAAKGDEYSLKQIPTDSKLCTEFDPDFNEILGFLCLWWECPFWFLYSSHSFCTIRAVIIVLFTCESPVLSTVLRMWVSETTSCSFQHIGVQSVQNPVSSVAQPDSITCSLCTNYCLLVYKFQLYLCIKGNNGDSLGLISSKSQWMFNCAKYILKIGEPLSW